MTSQLTPEIVRQAVASKTFLKDFPQFTPVPRAPFKVNKQCSRCTATRKDTAQVRMFTAILLALPKELQERVKQRLGITVLHVYVYAGGGKRRLVIL